MFCSALRIISIKNIWKRNYNKTGFVLACEIAGINEKNSKTRRAASRQQVVNFWGLCFLLWVSSVVASSLPAALRSTDLHAGLLHQTSAEPVFPIKSVDPWRVYHIHTPFALTAQQGNQTRSLFQLTYKAQALALLFNESPFPFSLAVLNTPSQIVFSCYCCTASFLLNSYLSWSSTTS